MSIFSSIASGIKSAYNTVRNAVSSVFSSGSQTAAVGNATPTKTITPTTQPTQTSQTLQTSSQTTAPKTTSTISTTTAKSTPSTASSSNYSPISGYSNPSALSIQATGYTAPKTITSGNLASSTPIIQSSTPQPVVTRTSYGGTSQNIPSTVTPTPVVKTLTTNPTGQGIQGANGTYSVNGQQNLTEQQKIEKQQQEGKTMQQLVDENAKLYPDPVDYASLYQQARRDTGVEAKQLHVNELQNQLNTINSQVNTDLMSLRNVGAKEGVTEAVYGQQAAEIGREGAIRALPIEAQLSAAQGDLQMAENSLDTLYKLKVQSAEQNFQKWTRIVDNARDAFTKQEQTKIDAKKSEFASNSSRLKDAVDFTQQLSLKAIENGKANYVSMLGSLKEPDPMSPTFIQDLQSYNQQVNKYAQQIGEGTTSLKAPEVKSINGVDMQWSSSEGKWVPITTNESKNNQLLPLAQIQSNIDMIDNLISDKSISSVVGPTMLARLEGRGIDSLTGARQNFIASIEQIRSNLNLDALINAKSRGATFGALSDQELRVLANSATKIGSWAKKDSSGNVVAYSASERDFKKELEKINNFAKLDYIRKGGEPMDIGGQLQSDGSIYVKNSDGSVTKLK